MVSDPADPGHRRESPVGRSTPPAARHLEVLPPARDGLLVLLAGAAGCIDALCYLRLGNVFTANMTGNAVLLGIATGQQVGARALHSAVALAGFVLGVLAGAELCGRHRGSQTGGWPLGVTLALGVELVLLGALAVGWALAGADPAGIAEYGLVGISALAMGLQSAAVRELPVGGVATTYVTGTLTGLLAGLALGGTLPQGATAPSRGGAGPGGRRGDRHGGAGCGRSRGRPDPGHAGRGRRGRGPAGQAGTPGLGSR
jgi:uncharacterized membrane protein YoaK (UPF0700 family)